MRPVTRALRRFAVDTRGATAIEYGLILALLSMVIIGAVTATGAGIYNQLANVAANVAAH